MPTDVKTYDPAQIQLSVGGAILTGYEPGTFVTLTRNVDNFTATIGPDGKELIRTKSNDRSGLLTFTLRQSSVANLILSNLANRDEVDSDGVVPCILSDLNNPDTEFASPKAWVQKPPDAVFADTPQGRPWQIYLAEVPMTHGGNPSTAALQGTIT